MTDDLHAWDLPRFLTSFVGRDAERAAVGALLRNPDMRWLTLTGPGGVGKTRLAVRVAADLAQETGTRVVFAALAAVATPDDMFVRIAHQLDPKAADLDPRATLRRWFAGRRALAVLDNAEQLLDAGAALVELLKAPGCEQLTLLVTSRARFRMAGEHVYPLDPLRAPREDARLSAADLESNDAMRLFVTRALAARADRPPEAMDPAVVAGICRKLDGLPLAIELAAARTDALSLDALLIRLDQRLPVLTRAPADAEARHRTMRDAIAWGYELLTAEQQRLLQRLAVFSGGFSPDLAARVLRGRAPGRGYPFGDGFGLPFGFQEIFDDPGPDECPALDAALPLAPLAIDPDEGIAQLQAWSLIYPYDGPDGSLRFGMLDTIREFALEQLKASGEADVVRHAHAATMLAFAEASNEGVWVSTKRRWDLARVDAEQDNIRSAIEWLLQRGDDAADLALRFVDCMSAYWQIRGMLLEGSHLQRRAIARPAGGIYRRLNAHNSLGFFAWIMGDVEEAEAVLTKSVELGAHPEAHGRTGVALFYLALVEWRKGPHRIIEMLTYLEQAVVAFASWNDWIGLGVCKLALGEAARLTEDPETAIDLFDEAFEYHSTGGYDWGVATSRYFTGEAMRDLKDYPESASYLCDGLRRYWTYGDVWGAGGCICGIACIAAARAEWEVAARLFGAAYQMRERIHAVLPPTHQAAYDAISAGVRAETGDAPFTEGQSLTPAQAVEEALAHGERFARDEPVGARAKGVTKLTKRQRAVLVPFSKGLDHEVIARQLGRTIQAVYGHTAAIRDAWGLNTYEELRERARELGYHQLD